MASRLLLVNATHASRNFAQRDLGAGVWQLSQPQDLYTGGFYYPGEVDTWANGDAISGYVPVSVVIAVVGGTLAGLGVNAAETIYQVTAVNSAFAPITVQSTAGQIVDSVIATSITTNSAEINGLILANIYTDSSKIYDLQGPLNNFGPALFGGILEGYIQGYAVSFNNDTIWNAAGGLLADTAVINFLCIDTGSQLNLIGDSSVYLSGVMYGAGRLNVVSGSMRTTDSAVSTFKLSGGLFLAGSHQRVLKRHLCRSYYRASPRADGFGFGRCGWSNGLRRLGLDRRSSLRRERRAAVDQRIENG